MNIKINTEKIEKITELGKQPHELIGTTSSFQCGDTYGIMTWKEDDHHNVYPEFTIEGTRPQIDTNKEIEILKQKINLLENYLNISIKE